MILLQLEFSSSIFSVLPFLIRSPSNCTSSSNFPWLTLYYILISFFLFPLSFVGSFSLTYLYIFLRLFNSYMVCNNNIIVIKSQSCFKFSFYSVPPDKPTVIAQLKGINEHILCFMWILRHLSCAFFSAMYLSLEKFF